ncbi:hypothetical protein [Streptomyces sp. NPDC002825]|uniref:hypothetical protein n=1 Tax=Streptomyces sp. NPDC002825 TaxID=3154666 RepID=UPI003318E60E
MPRGDGRPRRADREPGLQGREIQGIHNARHYRGDRLGRAALPHRLLGPAADPSSESSATSSPARHSAASTDLGARTLAADDKILLVELRGAKIPLPQAVPSERGKRGRPPRRSDTVLADRGFDRDKSRRLPWGLGVTPLIARRGTQHGSGPGTQRPRADARKRHLQWSADGTRWPYRWSPWPGSAPWALSR